MSGRILTLSKSILILIHILSTGTGEKLETCVSEILRYFECQGPVLILCPGVPAPVLAKHVSRENQMAAMVKTNLDSLNVEEMEGHLSFNSFVICPDSWSINATASALAWVKSHLDGAKKGVITCQNNSCLNLAQLEAFHIGEEIFLVNIETYDVMEAYTINRIVLTTVIGRINQSSFLRQDEPDTIVRRRSNLQKTEIVAVTDSSTNYIMFSEDYSPTSVNIIETPSGDLMEELPNETVTGIFADVLSLLAADLNFTIIMRTRRDQIWGTASVYGNGTSVFTGMLHSLHKGEGDILAAPLTNSYSR